MDDRLPLCFFHCSTWPSTSVTKSGKHLTFYFNCWHAFFAFVVNWGNWMKTATVAKAHTLLKAWTQIVIDIFTSHSIKTSMELKHVHVVFWCLRAESSFSNRTSIMKSSICSHMLYLCENRYFLQPCKFRAENWWFSPNCSCLCINS